jgi:hypothetical protein
MFFPKIDALRQKFAEHIRLSETADGLTPEKVLVLEIAGDPQNLAKRLSKVEGFEFMTSVILDRKYQDDEFYATDSHGVRKPLTKIAYLTMSNKDGLDKLYSIWKKFRDKKFWKGDMLLLFTPLNSLKTFVSGIQKTGWQILSCLKTGKNEFVRLNRVMIMISLLKSNFGTETIQWSVSRLRIVSSAS